MRTPSPHSERDRHAVQSRIQALLSGQRPRHPTLSRVSTGRLILEGIVEEVRIYRLNKEREVMRERERERDQRNERGEGGGDRSGRRRSRTDREERERRRRSGAEGLGDGGRGTQPMGGREENDEGMHGRNRHGRRERPDSSLPPTSIPPPTSPASRPEHRSSPPNSSPRDSVPSLNHQTNRHEHGTHKGKHRQKDPGPGPFPKWKPKLGPLLGLGDHLKDRYNWGVENHHYKQRNLERKKGRDRHENSRARSEVKEGKRVVGNEEGNFDRRAGKGRVEDESKKHDRERLSGQMSMEERRMRYGRARRRRDHNDMKFGGRTWEERQGDGGGKARKFSHRETGPDPFSAPNASTQRDGRRRKGSLGGYSNGRGSSHVPDVRGGKSYTGSRSTRPMPGQERHGPIPVYQATSHSQHVEERERAEALGSEDGRKANGSGSQTSYDSESSGTGQEDRSDISVESLSSSTSHQDPILKTERKAQASKIQSKGRKYDPYGSEDEQYNADHLHNERSHRTESIESSRSSVTSDSMTDSDHGAKSMRYGTQEKYRRSLDSEGRSINTSRSESRTETSQDSRYFHTSASHRSVPNSIHERGGRSLFEELGGAASHTSSSRSSASFESQAPPPSRLNSSDERRNHGITDSSPIQSDRSSISQKEERAPKLPVPPPSPPPPPPPPPPHGPPPMFIPRAPGPPPPPPPPGPPPASQKNAASGREAMLSDIQKGFKLKKVPDHERSDRSNAESITSGPSVRSNSTKEHTRQSMMSPSIGAGSGDFLSELMEKMNARRGAE